jgi:hypothetical protein
MWTPEEAKEVIAYACKVIGLTWVISHVVLALIAGFFRSDD